MQCASAACFQCINMSFYILEGPVPSAVKKLWVEFKAVERLDSNILLIYFSQSKLSAFLCVLYQPAKHQLSKRCSLTHHRQSITHESLRLLGCQTGSLMCVEVISKTRRGFPGFLLRQDLLSNTAGVFPTASRSKIHLLHVRKDKKKLQRLISYGAVPEKVRWGRADGGREQIQQRRQKAEPPFLAEKVVPWGVLALEGWRCERWRATSARGGVVTKHRWLQGKGHREAKGRKPSRTRKGKGRKGGRHGGKEEN